MSQSQESSYYEIALTNRQVVKLFAGLLVCIFVAFFAGVWIGKGDAEHVAAQQAGGDETAAAERAALAELNFFSENATQPKEPPLAGVVEEADPSTTLAEDIEKPPAKAPAQETRQAPAQQAAPAGDVEDGLVIQVFSSADEQQATQLVSRLRKGGYPAALAPIDVDGRTMYRVRVGPFDERGEAESVADRVRRAFRLDTWITQSG